MKWNIFCVRNLVSGEDGALQQSNATDEQKIEKTINEYNTNRELIKKKRGNEAVEDYEKNMSIFAVINCGVYEDMKHTMDWHPVEIFSYERYTNKTKKEKENVKSEKKNDA